MTSKNKKYLSSKKHRKKNTIIPNISYMEGYNLNTEYNGKNAKINLDLIRNGKTKHYEMNLNNISNKPLSFLNSFSEMKNLQNDVLNFASVDSPLEERLVNDFNLYSPNKDKKITRSLNSIIRTPLYFDNLITNTKSKKRPRKKNNK